MFIAQKMETSHVEKFRILPIKMIAWERLLVNCLMELLILLLPRKSAGFFGEGFFHFFFFHFFSSKRAQGQGCTTDCVGNSCESIYKLEGGCFLPSLTSAFDCFAYSSIYNITTEWYKSSVCTLPTIVSENECAEVFFIFSFLFCFILFY